MKFGKILHELREQKFIPKSRLAGAINVSRQQIRAYENGENIPNIETLLALAEFFGVSADFLLGREGFVTVASTAKKRYITLSDELTEEECELVRCFAVMLVKQKTEKWR